MSVIGKPLTRVDGRLKVTGAATYAAEFKIPNLTYAVIVQSTIPSGKIQSMDVSMAKRLKGVLAVMTPENAIKLPQQGRAAVNPPAGRVMSLLQDTDILYNNQPIAVVVAETLEQATHAASAVRVEYQASPAKLDFMGGFSSSYPPKKGRTPAEANRGDLHAGINQASVKVDEIYTTPIQNHNPMEPHATIAHWQDSKLTVYDATQYISGVKATLAKTLGIPDENVHVVCPYVGGGFGCKGSMWSHVVLAAMAAKMVDRPVKLVLDRPQMFGPVGARPRTHQHILLGATADGKLTAIQHDVHAHTSTFEDFLESSAVVTRMLYASPNLATTHRLVPLNVGTPTFQRAPGEATGTFALEVAMDELAYTLKMDPVQLRLVNYTDTDPQSKMPFSGKHLRECYTRGAERFGWAKRNAEPKSMKDGDLQIGWGMATASYPANRSAAMALVRFQPSGRVLVASGTQDLGTGTYTIMVQVAADTLGLAPSLIDAKLGDSTLPKAPVSGGSQSAASVTPAVRAAAQQARLKLFELAAGDAQSPVHGATSEEIDFKDSKIFLKSNPSQSEEFAALLSRHPAEKLEAIGEAQPEQASEDFSKHSFGAVFAEVAADRDVGTIRVRRIIGVYDIGKLLNEKTGKSQLIGGIVWGISLALHEETHVDWRNGRVINANLAEYHVPVNRDIARIDVSVLDVPDMNFNPLGARGIGEIGITGVGAAIANAVYHATGNRLRDLPITPDKVLAL
jgi:xanthine dehydrogenase YagR molybdenum-binding subunit